MQSSVHYFQSEASIYIMMLPEKRFSNSHYLVQVDFATRLPVFLLSDRLTRIIVILQVVFPIQLGESLDCKYL